MATKTKPATTQAHEPTPCRQLGGVHLQFATKSYSDAFECSCCGKVRRFNHRRVPMCDGTGIKAGDRLDFKTYRTLRDQSRATAPGTH